jgi:hypothetical protein
LCAFVYMSSIHSLFASVLLQHTHTLSSAQKELEPNALEGPRGKKLLAVTCITAPGRFFAGRVQGGAGSPASHARHLAADKGEHFDASQAEDAGRRRRDGVPVQAYMEGWGWLWPRLHQQDALH